MTDSNVNDCSPGTVFLVGAGPGDPGLMTVRALEVIRAADVIVYDYLAGDRFSEEARSDAELIYVGKKGRDHTLEQVDINTLLIEKARQGKCVARLKGGDPYVFGRGGEEAEDLVEAGIPFEVVPGVTSAVAAPAYAGIPVTHRDHASMVTFITGHENPDKAESAIDWDVLARNPGTLVFLMGVKNLPTISRSLIECGKPGDTPAALIRWGTTPQQVSIVSTLADLPAEAKKRGIKAPAVLVVGSVASLHTKLAWFEKRPLLGKKILVTRSRAQSRKMAEKISAQGGVPILFPTIEIGPPEDFTALDESIRRIKEFDWVIFTSVNGVERFFTRFFEIRDDIRDMAGPRIAAIGPVTAASIRKLGIKVDLLAKEYVAEGVLAQLAGEDVRDKRFLIPRAEKAREILPEGIAEMGGKVEVVPVYRTGMPEDSVIDTAHGMMEKGEVDAVTFTSSSTVTHFVEMLGAEDLPSLLRGTVVASIGPVTSQTAREAGLTVHTEASEYTIDGLVDALVRYFGSSKG
ncbi:MAG: uroporphyrinogen-III C-methyltransferase [Desulfomonilaceae bacterium]|nr:uroporphyrinogen-III C-methyltransferase [Desulfomonilaceae bacterium]